MSKITPLMTSLHVGHKTEERLKCIDNMLFKKCEDTKDTILQAFWWYRKYTKAKLKKLEQIEQIVNSWDGSIVLSANDWKYISEIKKVLEQE